VTLLSTRKSNSGPLDYEKKLARVMERFGIKEKEWNFNYDRQGLAWVEFRYKGELYRFEHSVEKAKARGITLKEGRDAFKQIVLTLEDLARMAERGIYDLQTWVKGMKFLPPVIEVPSFFKLLGFDSIPTLIEDVRARYRSLSKQLHPDAGGSAEDFDKLTKASEECIRYLSTVRK
jgi:hypothetical protein